MVKVQFFLAEDAVFSTKNYSINNCCGLLRVVRNTLSTHVGRKAYAMIGLHVVTAVL